MGVHYCQSSVRLALQFYHPGREYNVRVASRYFKGPELLVDLQVQCADHVSICSKRDVKH